MKLSIEIELILWSRLQLDSPYKVKILRKMHIEDTPNEFDAKVLDRIRFANETLLDIAYHMEETISKLDYQCPYSPLLLDEICQTGNKYSNVTSVSPGEQ